MSWRSSVVLIPRHCSFEFNFHIPSDSPVTDRCVYGRVQYQYVVPNALSSFSLSSRADWISTEFKARCLEWAACSPKICQTVERSSSFQVLPGKMATVRLFVLVDQLGKRADLLSSIHSLSVPSAQRKHLAKLWSIQTKSICQRQSLRSSPLSSSLEPDISSDRPILSFSNSSSLPLSSCPSRSPPSNQPSTPSTATSNKPPGSPPAETLPKRKRSKGRRGMCFRRARKGAMPRKGLRKGRRTQGTFWSITRRIREVSGSGNGWGDW